MYKRIGYLRWMGRGVITLPRRFKTAWTSTKWMRKKLLNNVKYIIGHPATEICIGICGIVISTFSIVTILLGMITPAFLDGFNTVRTWSIIGVALSFFLTTHGIYRSEVDC